MLFAKVAAPQVAHVGLHHAALERAAESRITLFAKVAAPQVAHVGLQHAALKRAAESRITLFTAPAGYVSGNSLAATLKETGRPTLWLRLGPEDADPATLLLSLIAGARRLCPDVGATTLEQMRRQPGPTAGWPPLSTHLGQELAEALPASTALVLEHVHHLAEAPPTLELLGAHLLPWLPTSTTCILTAHAQVPFSTWPTHTTHRGAGDLRVDVSSASALFQRAEIGLPTHCIERAVTLTEGRADVLASLCQAATVPSTALVQQTIERATGLDDLLFRVVCAGLETVNTDVFQALALAVRLEYSHPALVQATLGNVTLPAGPWLQVLADDWTRVRCAWKTPLRTALSARSSPSYATLHRMADYLASHDALEQAVPLYCEIGDMASAAQAIARAAETLIGLGQWQTLSNWLDQLTRPAMQSTERSSTPKPTSLWSRLLGALGLGRRPSGPAPAPEWYAPSSQGMLPDMTVTVGEAPRELTTDIGSASITVQPSVAPPTTKEATTKTIPTPLQPGLESPDRPIPAVMPFVRLTPKTHPVMAKDEKHHRPTLAVYCLGPFRVYQNDQLVTEWKSLKGYSILKYLVAHGGKPVSKDILMDVFWPNADPIAARRNLHQAVYALRQTLRQAQPDLQQIQFENDGYLLNPELDVWLDFEEFEQHMQAGRRLEAAGQIAAAVTEYAIAEGLYQGDFLEEDLYEDWPSSQREHLRNIYVEIAERLSEYYVQQGQYTVGVTLCHKVLERDPCHEESHRRLMQCYLAQGQRHLAIRQYHICVQALAKELDVPPADETRSLYASISANS